MIDVKHKICAHNDCMKQPSFNTSGETVAKFCKEHAHPYMIDVKNKTCAHIDCMDQTFFLAVY